MRKREDLKGFGARLRQLREEHNISQKDMIKMINDYYGLVRFKTVQAYNRYEIFDAQPDVDLLICFAHVLNMTVDYLVGNNVTPEKSTLYDSLSKVQKMGYTCTDRGNDIVEFISDDKDERYEAVFSYKDFISFVKYIDETAYDSYCSDFHFTFFQELLIYGYSNRDKVSYVPKNKNAYNMSKDWIKFNESKERAKSDGVKIYNFLNSLKESDAKNLMKAIAAGTEKENPLYKKLLESLDESAKGDGDK